MLVSQWSFAHLAERKVVRPDAPEQLQVGLHATSGCGRKQGAALFKGELGNGRTGVGAVVGPLEDEGIGGHGLKGTHARLVSEQVPQGPANGLDCEHDVIMRGEAGDMPPYVWKQDVSATVFSQRARLCIHNLS